MNYKIVGFGHYYKYGKVKRLYEQLDIFISKSIYEHYLKGRIKIKTGAYKLYLKQFGLKSLVSILVSNTLMKTAKSFKSTISRESRSKKEIGTEVLPLVWMQLSSGIEKLVEQQKQIIGILRNIEGQLKF